MLEVVIMVMSKIFFPLICFIHLDIAQSYVFDLKELKIIHNLFIIGNIKTS